MGRTGTWKEEEGEELSEEDIQLRTELEMLVERLKESNTDLYRPALETLRTLIRTSTSSMTSVPKSLKFLRPHYPELQKLYETWPASEDKSLFADTMSVLAMIYSDTQPRGTLRYRLLSASLRPADSPLADPGTWGREYVRHLAAELGEEFVAQEEGDLEPPEKGKEKIEPIGTIEQLRAIGRECATFLLAHNAEPDAADLLEELELVDQIADLVDDVTYGRVCQYWSSPTDRLWDARCRHLLPFYHGVPLQVQGGTVDGCIQTHQGASLVDKAYPEARVTVQWGFGHRMDQMYPNWLGLQYWEY
ncbi:hypothetical protein ARMGADRAFT_1097225 [Armillaria gallica]|uniref:RPN1 N-terminal domain-containing protein n=1 Tax=Armillaria gallica TaxID=47427 RepID=A0A2H3DLD9_ARMGA|nr:hypothetical protein ARMGADRAFT_1097225 [Armillaria gallica]